MFVLNGADEAKKNFRTCSFGRFAIDAARCERASLYSLGKSASRCRLCQTDRKRIVGFKCLREVGSNGLRIVEM